MCVTLATLVGIYRLLVSAEATATPAVAGAARMLAFMAVLLAVYTVIRMRHTT